MVAAIAIELGKVADHVIGLVVGMVVLCGIPWQVPGFIAGNDGHVRVLRLDGVIKHREAVRRVRGQTTVEVVLVADLDEVDLPRLGVAQRGP